MNTKDEASIIDSENTCDKCEVIMQSERLMWITSEDFTPHKGEVLKESARENDYQALCDMCYHTELK